MWFWRANPFSSKFGKSLRFGSFPFINMYFNRILLVLMKTYCFLFYSFYLRTLRSLHIKKMQCLYLWLQAGLSATAVTFIKDCLLLSCLVYCFQLRLINRCYLAILLPFILFICICTVVCTEYFFNASRLAGIQSGQIADFSCHLTLNRAPKGHWTDSSRSEIQHLKLSWHFSSIRSLGSVTTLKIFKLAQNLSYSILNLDLKPYIIL